MEEAVAAELAKHWHLLLGVGGGLLAAGALLRGAFTAYFWSEKRTERVVGQVLASKPVQEAMVDIAEGVFARLAAKDEGFRAELKAALEELRGRDKERQEAITRLHGRMDDLQLRVIDGSLTIARATPPPR